MFIYFIRLYFISDYILCKPMQKEKEKEREKDDLSTKLFVCWREMEPLRITLILVKGFPVCVYISVLSHNLSLTKLSLKLTRSVIVFAVNRSFVLGIPLPEVALDDGVRTGRFCRRYPTSPVTPKHDAKARLGRYPVRHEYQTSAGSAAPFRSVYVTSTKNGARDITFDLNVFSGKPISSYCVYCIKRLLRKRSFFNL